MKKTKLDHNEHWQSYGETGTLLHYWEREMVKFLWKIASQFHKMFNMALSNHLTSLLFSIDTTQNENAHCYQKNKTITFVHRCGPQPGNEDAD